MKIVAHDEDSMTNLFFSEVHRQGEIEAFLNLIEWRDAIIPFKISSAELHQQVNFSEFGKPDVVIIATDTNGQKHIVIVEVKLRKYLECCINNKNGKFNNKNKFISRLNNQLTLRYRAMKSLSSISHKGFITESTHIAESPYSEDKVRRCKKPTTINLFETIAQESFQFYLVTLTSDNESPLNKDKLYASDPCFPLFFNQHSVTKEDFLCLGSISWYKCNQLFDGMDSHFSDSFSLHFCSQPENEKSSKPHRKKDMFVQGRQIIKYHEMLCHLSCKEYSYAIRHFRKGLFVEIDRGKNDKEKYLDLKSQIQILEKAPAKPIEDIEFWETYFSAKQASTKHDNNYRKLR